ncbi:hypothetical protein B0H11DRAFT_356046 [Mycena galericulata]|nr:hypothetical protein B0H11DRAFT_356046 [Mycena galericulata]
MRATIRHCRAAFHPYAPALTVCSYSSQPSVSLTPRITLRPTWSFPRASKCFFGGTVLTAPGRSRSRGRTTGVETRGQRGVNMSHTIFNNHPNRKIIDYTPTQRYARSRSRSQAILSRAGLVRPTISTALKITLRTYRSGWSGADTYTDLSAPATPCCAPYGVPHCLRSIRLRPRRLPFTRRTLTTGVPIARLPVPAKVALAAPGLRARRFWWRLLRRSRRMPVERRGRGNSSKVEENCPVLACSTFISSKFKLLPFGSAGAISRAQTANP